MKFRTFSSYLFHFILSFDRYKFCVCLLVMPASRNKIVRKYFEYKKSENKSICKVNVVGEGIAEREENQCGIVLKNTKVSNLRSHLQARHKSTYDLLLAEEKRNSEPIKKQTSLLTYSDSISLQVSRVEVIKGLLALVTVDGRPFSALEDEGFTIAFKPILQRLKLSFHRLNISTLIQSAAEYIKRKIREVLKDTLVSAKVDAVSRFSRSFLGINIQAIIDHQIELFVLGVQEIKVEHSGANMKILLNDCLAKYNIFPKQSYSVTSDNGSNMIKMTELVDADYRNLRYQDIPEINLNDEDELTQFVECICGDDWADDEIICVNCIAHTLQLAILDSLKNAWEDEGVENYVILIKSARELVKNLRKQNNLLLLTAKGKCRPTLDVKTRWGSTYKMLHDLFKMKEVCIEAVDHGNRELFLPDDTWKGIEEIVQTLKPSYIATKELQEENLTLPDARKVIELCWMETSEIGTPLSQELVYNFEKRREQIMNGHAMHNAIFLDPRHLFQLSESERDETKKRLIALHSRLSKLQLEEAEENPMCQESENSDFENLGDYGDEDDVMYERSMAEKFKNAAQKKISRPVSQFENELLAFEKQYVSHRLESRSSVLNFWKENMSAFPNLHRVALIVLAGAGTQVSVERLFSQLKFILNDQRSNLSSENVENILLVRGNFQYLDDKFFRKVIQDKILNI